MFTESGRKTQFRAIYNMRLRGPYFLTLISVLFAPMTLIAAVGFQKKPCRILPFSTTTEESRILCTAATPTEPGLFASSTFPLDHWDYD